MYRRANIEFHGFDECRYFSLGLNMAVACGVPQPQLQCMATLAYYIPTLRYRIWRLHMAEIAVILLDAVHARRWTGGRGPNPNTKDERW